MDYALIIGFAKWFLLRQIEKYVEKIDWEKVAADFVDRIAKMVPSSVFGDLEKSNTKVFIVDFGKAYEARGIAGLYGTGQFIAAFEGCFGDTDAAKLTASQSAYLAKAVEKKPEKKAEVAAVKPEKKEDKGGFLGAKKSGKKA